MLKEELWTRRTIAEITILKKTTKIEDSDILKKIRNNNTREKEDSKTWEEKEIVYKKEKIYIPNNKKLKERILKENHNSVYVRHLEQQRM